MHKRIFVSDRITLTAAYNGISISLTALNVHVLLLSFESSYSCTLSRNHTTLRRLM